MSTEPTDLTHRGSPERFDPRDDAGKLVHSEHVARYRWASQLVRGRDTLDAGCGTGYGTRLLADAGPSRLVAVDIAEEAVEQTREDTGDRAEVEVGDVRALPFDDSSFDVVVCFEVIEHIDRRDDALREFARVLRPGGTLVISSPNRDLYLPGNEFHVHEYTPQELEQELRELFANVRLHSQNAWLGSVLSGSDGSALERARRDGGSPLSVELIDGDAPSRDGTFVLAVAGDGPLPEVEARVVLGDPFEVKWWADEMHGERERAAAAQAEALRHRRELRFRDARLEEASTRLLEIEQRHASLLAERHDLRAELEDTRAELERVRYLYDRSNQVVADLQGSFSWRLTEPLRRLKAVLRG